MRKLATTCFILAVAATSGGATDCGQILDDPGFDVWCGDTLCRWRVEKGDVARAPTWHEGDNGVELVGTDVSISQITSVNADDGHCVYFSLIADIAEDAEVRLQMDIYGDGSAEFDERLPTADWHRLSYQVRMPAFYQGVRFRLTKAGSGKAVLANIGAEIIDDASCPNPPLTVGLRPLGVGCDVNAECVSGVCAPTFFGGLCAECADTVACGGGEICGLASPVEMHQEPWPACEAPASAGAGSPCRHAAECATGICEDGACGLCLGSAECGGGNCTQIAYTIAQADAAPVVIKGARHCVVGAAGAAMVAAGGHCLGDDDCASGACAGAPLKACRNALGLRECATDMDCPLGFGGNPTCVTVGTRGGTCQ